MKVLLISSYLPYPLFSGGYIRLYNLIKCISKNNEITLICEKRSNQSFEDEKKLRKYCKKVVTVEKHKQWSLANILGSGLSSYPFLMTGHTNKKFQQAISYELENQQFDVVHVETFYIMQNLPINTKIPIVLVEHNVEYNVYKRFVRKAPFVLKPFLEFDIQKIKKWETYYWDKVTQLVAVSEIEKKEMARKNVAVVPNGVDIKKFAVRSSQFADSKNEKRVLFIGDFRWIQNRDSIQWILKEVWPEISSKLKVKSSKFNLKLWVVGRNIPQSLRKITDDGSVVFDEDAPEDAAEIFKRADVLLAPIRVGGGTSYKILEAMASGVVVVTTPLGVEGIQAENNKEVLVAEDTDALAEATVNLLNDAALYKKIALQARKHIEQNYDWKNIAQKLEEVYSSAVG